MKNAFVKQFLKESKVVEQVKWSKFDDEAKIEADEDILSSSFKSTSSSKPILSSSFRSRSFEERNDDFDVKEDKITAKLKHRRHFKLKRDSDPEVESGVDIAEEIEITQTSDQIDTKSITNISQVDDENKEDNFDQYKKLLPSLVTLLIIIIVYFINIIPPFVKGVIICLLVQKLFDFLYKLVVILINDTFGVDTNKEEVQPVIFTTCNELPEVLEHYPVKEYDGWMNEIDHYDPSTFHRSLMRTVYVKLTGSKLTVCETNHRVNKHAIWSEKLPQNVSFNNKTRVYNLHECSIEMCPKKLARKRHYSRKYPILITIKSGDLNDSSVSRVAYDGKPSEVQDFGATIMRTETINQLQKENSLHDILEPKDKMPQRIRQKKLYLFARSDREKEDWYRRFKDAVQGKTSNNVNVFYDAIDDSNEDSAWQGLFMTSSSGRCNKDFIRYMTRYQDKKDKGGQVTDINEMLWENIETKSTSKSDSQADGIWVNILIGRVLYSCLNDAVLLTKIEKFIQKKISVIKLPNFMEEVKITAINLGNQPPNILKLYQPSLDERGLWCDVDISYEGLLSMTIEAKLNPLRQKKEQSPDHLNLQNVNAIYDSDAESSGDSSSDSDDNYVPCHDDLMVAIDDSVKMKNKRNVLKIIDRITTSNIFQSATEITYIQKAVENMKARITLRVDVKSIVGTFVLNIPPPPSDRVWMCFRKSPKIIINATPAVNDHTVDWNVVTNIIENRLLNELDKYFVYPNMIDVSVPFLGEPTYLEKYDEYLN